MASVQVALFEVNNLNNLIPFGRVPISDKHTKKHPPFPPQMVMHDNAFDSNAELKNTPADLQLQCSNRQHKFQTKQKQVRF